MDAENFKRIFLPYHQKLYRIAFRIVENQDEAKDIVQDTYLKLWSKRENMIDLNNTEAFAITIAKNLCLDYIRNNKKKRTQEYDPNTKEIMVTSPLTDLEILDKTSHIKRLIKSLPIQQRQVLILKDWDGYENEEIETITGLSGNNIRVILSRARKTIREQYLKLYDK